MFTNALPVIEYCNTSFSHDSLRPASFAAAAKLLQSFPTLFDPIEGSPPGSPVPGILQARTLEWVAISFSNAWKWKVKVKSLSRVGLYRPHGLQPTRLLRPWDFPRKSTGVGCHYLLLLLHLGIGKIEICITGFMYSSVNKTVSRIMAETKSYVFSVTQVQIVT